MRQVLLALVAIVLCICSMTLPSCSRMAQPGGDQGLRRLASAPDDVRRAAAHAFAGFDKLQATLAKRLMTEMQAGGPIKAVTACRDEAQQITSAVRREQGIEMGRTSARLRNVEANRPPGWASAHVAGSDGRRASEMQPMVVDLGDRIGVVRPIATAALCTRCHGEAASFEPELTAAIGTAYPQDRATGFREGDLRGFFWAEVPKQ